MQIEGTQEATVAIAVVAKGKSLEAAGWFRYSYGSTPGGLDCMDS
jgi:hypothetical protein